MFNLLGGPRGAAALASVSLAALVASISPALAQEQTRAFDIPAQSLSSALIEFARQSDVRVLADPNLVNGRHSPGVSGALTVETALERLLAGTGLRPTRSGDGGLTVVADTSSPTRLGAVEHTASSATQAAEDIVVTGTRIRGAAPSAAFVSISQEEMRRAGHANLGEVVRALPQSFSGGQNPGVLGGAQAGFGSSINSTGGSSLNLRGLGPDASLTLLNGARLPYDGFSQATDISSIPLAAIGRIEILLDGASAIYGSDAVGGVANIVLRRDFSGVEFFGRVGGADAGGYQQRQASVVFGQTWSTGAVLAAFDHAQSGAVRARDRDFLAYLPAQDVTLHPRADQDNLLFSARQHLGARFQLSADLFFNDRKSDTLTQSGVNLVATRRNSQTWGLSPSLEYEAANDWRFRLSGFVGENETEFLTVYTAITGGALVANYANCYCNSAVSFGAEAEGPIVQLPAGDARVSIGGGYRRNSLEILDLMTGAIAGTDGEDASRYAFVEMRAPLIAPDQNVPFVNALAVNGALRYETYDSFSDVTTPKLGLLWDVTEQLSVRASWGRSFKVPTLFEQFNERALYLYPASFFGGPAGQSVIYEAGGNPQLRPEEAETLSVGITWRPRLLAGLEIQANWFSVDYEDRVANPAVNTPFSAFSNPIFAAFVTVAPSLGDQTASFDAFDLPFGAFTANVTGAPFDTNAVYGILHNTSTNAVSQNAEGVDLTLSYHTDLFGGQVATSLSASWLDSERQLTALSGISPTSGEAFYPPDVRARASVSWSNTHVSAALFANHSAGVRNSAVSPPARGKAMTTFDLTVGYRFTRAAELGLTIANMLDEPPPYLSPALPYYVNYDSTNYSALGRVLSLTLSARF